MTINRVLLKCLFFGCLFLIELKNRATNVYDPLVCVCICVCERLWANNLCLKMFKQRSGSLQPPHADAGWPRTAFWTDKRRGICWPVGTWLVTERGYPNMVELRFSMQMTTEFFLFLGYSYYKKQTTADWHLQRGHCQHLRDTLRSILPFHLKRFM